MLSVPIGNSGEVHGAVDVAVFDAWRVAMKRRMVLSLAGIRV